MSEPRLEALLFELSTEIDYPATPDLATRASARLTHDPLAPERRTRPSWRPALVAVVVVFLAIAFTLALSPVARRAAADLLGIVGIHISVGDGNDRSTEDIPGPGLTGLELGELMSPERAEEIVGFPVRGPKAMLGPSHTYVDRSVGDSGMVSTVFYAPEHPRHPSFLITEFRASVDETFIKKVSQTGGNVRFVPIGPIVGYWLSGEPHLFYYYDSDGNVGQESIRLAGNVLLWEEDGITYRIEGASFLGEAQNIAATIR